MNDGLRLAMWSGPRNISTAMMRSWESRSDAAVCDEPLYAHYLQATGATHHPGYAETLANHETDWRKVVAWLLGPIPDGKAIFYQKQMAHHLLPGIDRDWTARLTNVLLIRDPREVLPSLAEFIPQPRAVDVGLPQQVELLSLWRSEFGIDPPIIDARDVLDNPAAMLRALCDCLRISFDEAMLEWRPGPRTADGAWGPFWYEKTYRTTTFAPYRPPTAPFPDHLLPVLGDCEPLYAQLHAQRLQTIMS